jgi:4-hydroxy-3-polyprenylbenzoate decarboxylase
MMFNKYMVIAPSECDIRSREEVFALLRGLDPERNLIWSEGVLDVLDHTTPTTGYGSKLAIDLTDISTEATKRVFDPPRTAHPEGGVLLFNTEYCRELGLLVLYAEREWREKIDVEAYLEKNNIRDIKYVALFDHGAAGNMRGGDLLWLAAANVDPKRDIRISKGVVIIDARSKRPAYGDNPRRFPNVVTSHPETIHLVNDRWAEYNLGDMVESPSRRYRKLWLSDGAEW